MTAVPPIHGNSAESNLNIICDLIIKQRDILPTNRFHTLLLTKDSRTFPGLNRTLSTKQPSILLRLYKSLVRPHLEYCSPAWSPKYVKELLKRVQHRFTRFFKENAGSGLHRTTAATWFMDSGRKT